MIVLDTETTGLPPASADAPLDAWPRIVEIGAAGPEWEAHQLINPLAPIPAEVIALHGITDAAVANKPTLAAVWSRLCTRIPAGSVVWAHHAVFDREVLQHEAARHGLAAPGWRWRCSKALARTLYPGLPGHRLVDLARVFGVTPGTHRAAADVATLRSVLAAMRVTDADGAETEVVW